MKFDTLTIETFSYEHSRHYIELLCYLQTLEISNQIPCHSNIYHDINWTTVCKVVVIFRGAIAWKGDNQGSIWWLKNQQQTNTKDQVGLPLRKLWAYEVEAIA